MEEYSNMYKPIATPQEIVASNSDLRRQADRLAVLADQQARKGAAMVLKNRAERGDYIPPAIR